MECTLVIILTILLGYFLYLKRSQSVSNPVKSRYRVLRNSLRNTLQKNTKVIWFYKPGCVYCDRMKDAWNQLKLSGLPHNVTLQEINTALPENAEISDKYSVSSVPHIVKQKVGSDGKIYVKVYDGDRSMQSMRSWILE